MRDITTPAAREPSEAEVADGLIRYLRIQLGDPQLCYAEPPIRVLSGVENWVYTFRLGSRHEQFSGPLILKLFGHHHPAERARYEAAVQNAVAGLDYPAPRVLRTGRAGDGLGGAFLIMERLPGTVLLEPLTKLAPRTLELLRLLPQLAWRMPRLVAAVQSRLHDFDPAPVIRSLSAAGFSEDAARLSTRSSAIASRIDRAGLEGLRPAMAWLEQHRPPEPERLAICHGDLWFGNLLTLNGEVVGVLDWSMYMVAVTDPMYDVGITHVGLLRGVADLPGPLQHVARWFQRGIARRYLAAYARCRPVDRAALGYYETFRCVDALSWVGERRRGLIGAIRSDSGPNMWDVPGSADGYIEHVRLRTGITPTLPS
jgi:aminoglycoside phosphotransferase (APT) family kinase protein